MSTPSAIVTLPLDRLPAFYGAARPGYGRVFKEPVDVVDALIDAGLDYTVVVTEDDVVAPMAVSGGTANITMSGFRGVIRLNADGTRSGLGVVKTSYRTCQNADAFDFAQSLLDDFGANVVAAAAWGNPVGAKAFLALRLPDTLMAGGTDPHDVYVVVSNSHDGSSALTARVAPIRRATGAEITAPLVGAPMSYTLRHTGDMGAKFRDAEATMSTVRRWIETYESATFALLAEKMTSEQFAAFAKQALPTPKGSSERSADQWAARRATLIDLFENGKGQGFGRGTRYAAFTAFCEYVDFHSATRGGDPSSIRQDRLLSGRAARQKADAWALLTR